MCNYISKGLPSKVCVKLHLCRKLGENSSKSFHQLYDFFWLFLYPFFTSMCSTWFLFLCRFIEVSSCPFVLSPIFLYSLLFEFPWAFVKKSIVTFSEYGSGGREQGHKKIYKQEDLQQIPFENIALRLWLSTQSAFFFHSSEPVHSSWRSAMAVNYPTVIARILRSIVWT